MSVMRVSRRSSEGYDAQNPDAIASEGKAEWTTLDPKDKHIGGSLVENTRRIINDRSDYLASCERHQRMFRNESAQGTAMPMRVLRLAERSGSVFMPRIGLNVARPMCNAVKSRITKNRIRLMFTTDGAGRAERDLTRLRELYVDGLFHQEDAHYKFKRVFADATVFGTGYMKVFDQGSRVHFERIYPPEVVIDRVEGADANPRTIRQIKFVDKHVLARRFPDYKKQILGMRPGWDDLNLFWRNYTTEVGSSNMLMVSMGWCKPSEEGADDGRWAIGINDLTLDAGIWRDMEHPIHEMRWSQSPIGYEGMGLCEELVGIQAELNRIVRRIQAGMILLSNPFVFMHAQAGIVPSHIQGIPGTVLKHNGFEPKVYAPQTVHQEVFAHMDRLYQRAFELAGISQMMAAAKVPANLESGRAQLVHDDIQSDRLSDVQQEYQRLHVRVGRAAIRCGVRSGYKVTLLDPTSNKLRKVSAKDLGLERDDFVVKVWPTSILGSSPEGRLDIIERMAGQGLVVDVEEKVEALDDLDVVRMTRRRLSPRRYLERIFEDMLYRGAKFIPPDSSLDLMPAIKIARSIYAEGLADGASDAGLLKIANWIAQAVPMSKKQAAPLAMGGAPTPPVQGPAGPGSPVGPGPAGPVAPPPATPNVAA